MTEREIFKKFGELSNDELDELRNKSVFVNNTIMTSVIKNCKGEKKRGVRAAEGFRKKLKIPDDEIYQSTEQKIKSKIGTIFENEKILEEYSVKIYETDLYFSEHYEKKYKLIVMVNNIYILFRIDIYFTKYCLAVEIDEKGHTDRDLTFEQKRQEALEKNLTVHLLELILVKKILMQIMKLVEYKRLLVNLKTIKTKNQKMK